MAAHRGAAQSQLVLATRARQGGPAAAHTSPRRPAATAPPCPPPAPGPRPRRQPRPPPPRPAGDPARAGSGGSVTRLAASAVDTDPTCSARTANARSQPRTVRAGRPSRAAIVRCPAPAAFASSPRPITSPASARRARHRPAAAHALPRTPGTAPGAGKTTRQARPQPHPPLGPVPPPGQHAPARRARQLPPPICRSTTSRSAFTVSTSLRASTQRPSRPRLPDRKKRRAAPMSDVITVPSHTKDNPKAPLKPVRAVNDATGSLHPQSR